MHLRADDPGKALKVAAGLGYVFDWQVLGPFNNERGGGFSEPGPPEKEIAEPRLVHRPPEDQETGSCGLRSE